MATDRREFLGRLAGGAALAAGGNWMRSVPAGAVSSTDSDPADQWDTSWPDRITGKSRAVFDCTEIESGTGLFRALLWKKQYAETLGIPPTDTTAVVVIRHDAIPLAMQQEFWDKYHIGKDKKVKHPFTDESTTRNPILLSSERGELPQNLATLNLGGFLQSGGIALACNLAFADCVRRVAKGDGVDETEARRRALALLSPGIILQPSGVFAAIRAQEAGCHYLKAS